MIQDIKKEVTQKEIDLAWRGIHTIFDLICGRIVEAEIKISTPPTIKHYNKLMHIINEQLNEEEQTFVIGRLFEGKTYTQMDEIVDGKRRSSRTRYMHAVWKLRNGTTLPSGKRNVDYLKDDSID